MLVISSQYWNSVHGDHPDEVKEALEGLQTMRVVADNMAWILKSIKAGRNAGIQPPVRENRMKTSFYKPHN